MIYASLFCSGYRYIVSDCDSVDVLYTQQHYTKTPEEAAAITIKSGPFIRRKTQATMHKHKCRCSTDNADVWMMICYC